MMIYITSACNHLMAHKIPYERVLEIPMTKDKYINSSDLDKYTKLFIKEQQQWSN